MDEFLRQATDAQYAILESLREMLSGLSLEEVCLKAEELGVAELTVFYRAGAFKAQCRIDWEGWSDWCANPKDAVIEAILDARAKLPVVVPTLRHENEEEGYRRAFEELPRKGLVTYY